MIFSFNPYSYHHKYRDDYDTRHLGREVHCVQYVLRMCKVGSLPYRRRYSRLLCHRVVFNFAKSIFLVIHRRSKGTMQDFKVASKLPPRISN